MINLKAPVSSDIIHGVSIICRRDRRFLLVKRAKEPMKNWLAFPGGSVEKGETAIEAAHRELFEETALKAENLKHYITVDLMNDANAYDRSYYLAVFYAEGLHGEEKAGDDALSLHWLFAHEMKDAHATPSTCAVAYQIDALNQLSK